MADWRDGNSGADDKGKKRNRPAPPPTRPSSTPTPASDWRGSKSAAPTTSARSAERSWTGAPTIASPGSSVTKKLLVVGTIGLLTVLSIIAFTIALFMTVDKLPVLISISGSESTSDDKELELGENPYGSSLKEYFRRLPRDSTVVFGDAPSSNFVQDMRRTQENPRAWLESLKVNSQFLKGGRVKGGGPSDRLCLYFVSCFVVRSSVNPDEWLLVSDSKIPYPWGSIADNGSETFTIDHLLEHILEQTNESRTAWVALDVQLPPPTNNLDDLLFPIKAFEDAYAKVTSANPTKELILALPCSQPSERNWIAPEFACSAFAHFFLDGLATGFSSQQSFMKQTMSNDLSVDEFEKNLAASVSHWAGVRRHAQQTPKFLKPESLGSLPLVQVSSSDPTSIQSLLSPTKDELERNKRTLESRYVSLEKLWSFCSKWPQGYLWDPLGFAEIESLLIQMENVAPYCLEAEWEIYHERANQRIESFTQQSTFGRRVSLVETFQQSRLRPTTIVGFEAKEAGFQKLLAPFLSTLIDQSKRPDGSSGGGRNGDLQKLLLWSALVEIASSNDPATQAQVFRGQPLGNLLRQFGAPDETGCEWLEIQFLNILQEAIQWDKDSMEPNLQQIRATCYLISSFHALQEITHSPFPEVAKQVEEDRAKLDARLLQSLDYFVANRWEKIEYDLSRELEQLKGRVRALENTILLRDQLCRDAVHNLSALIQLDRVEQFNHSTAKDGEKESAIHKKNYELLAKRLGKLVEHVLAHSHALPVLEGSEAFAATLEELHGVESELRQHLENVNTSDQDQQGQHIRQIALRWPLLNSQQRQQFHSELTGYWFTAQNTLVSTTAQTAFTYSDTLLTSFLNEIDPSNRELCSDLMQRPRSFHPRTAVRASGGQALPDEASLTASERLYQRNLYARFLSGTFGHYLNSKHLNESRLEADDFLLAPQKYWRVCDAEYRNIQVDRLCQAAWGAADLQGLPADDLYVAKLVQQYLKDLPSSEKGRIENIQNSLKSVQNILTQSKFEIVQFKNNELELAADKFQPLQQHKIGLSLRQLDFEPVLGKSGRRAVQLEYSEDMRGLPPINLDSTSGTVLLRFRGNYFAQPLPDPGNPDGYEVAFQNRATDRASLSVTASYESPVSVVLLLDCSNSMARKGIYAEAQKVVTRLMDRMEELVGQERRNIQLHLMTFAVSTAAQNFLDRNAWETLPEPASVYKDNPIHNTYLYWTKRDSSRSGLEETLLSIRKSRDLLNNLDINVLASGSFTPLYHAIIHASRHLEAHSPQDTRRVVIVISDGFNWVPEVLDDLNTVKVRESLAKSKSELFIFQYENDQSIREIAKSGGTESPEELKAKNVRDLQVLMNLGSDRKLLYDNFEDMQTDLETLFPRWRVDLMQPTDGLKPLDDDATFGKKIPVRLEKGRAGSATVRGYEIGSDPSQKAAISSTVFFEGDEHLRMLQRGKTLEFIRFAEDLNENAPDDGLQEMEPRSNSSAKTEHIVRGSLIERSGKIELRSAISLRNESSQRTEFVRRPKLLLAEIHTREPKDGDRVVFLSDVNFRKGTHYPIVEFPSIPWQTPDKDWISDKVDVDLWIADRFPEGTLEFSWTQLEQGKAQLPESIRVKIEDGQATMVNSYSRSEERFFVVCRHAKESKREYQKGKDTHYLTRDPAVPEPVIQFVPRKSLDEWTDDGKVEHFWEHNVAYRR